MRPRTLATITAVPLALAAVSVALASGATTAHQDRAADGRTLTFYQGEDPSQTFVDAVPLSPTRDSNSPRFRSSPGDHLYFGGPLFTRKGGSRTGRIDFELTALRGQGDKIVTLLRGTIVLRDGLLTLEGVYPHAGGLAVTGGTGAYAGARGVARQDDTGTDTITLLP
jgi:hypothetical protein